MIGAGDDPDAWGNTIEEAAHWLFHGPLTAAERKLPPWQAVSNRYGLDKNIALLAAGKAQKMADQADPIGRAAAWLKETGQENRPTGVVDYVRKMFGLSTADAIEAIRRSRR